MKKPVPIEVRRLAQDHRGPNNTEPLLPRPHQDKNALRGRDHPSQAKFVAKWLLCTLPQYTPLPTRPHLPNCIEQI